MKIQSENILDSLSVITDSQLSADDYATYLTAHERAELENKPDKKKHLSAMGRVAVKNSIRRDAGSAIPYHAIEVFTTSTGVPKYKIDNQEQSGHISISHTKSIAIGGVARNVCGFGLDIEAIRVFNENTIQSFMTDIEWTQYRTLQGENKSLFPTLMWSIKEATAKALGEGLRLHPKKIAVKLDGKLQVEHISVRGSKLEAKTTWTLFESLYIMVLIQIYEKS